jgi:hypothetical protein
LNKRMDNFSRNLSDEFKKNTTWYKEERNIANKEKLKTEMDWTMPIEVQAVYTKQVN